MASIGGTSVTRMAFRDGLLPWGALASLAIAVLAAGAATMEPARPSDESAQIRQPRTGAQPYRDNERVIVEPDGSRIFLARWAIGSRDHVVRLRIPLEHVPIAGAAPFGANYPDPNYQQPFMTTVGFDAMLWDMRPVVRNRRLPREEGIQLIHGLIESIFFGSKIRNEDEQLRSTAENRLRFLHWNSYRQKYNFGIVRKPDRFGLRRIGAAHELGYRTPVGLKDLYYAGDEPQTSDDFMLCTDDAVPDDPPPGKFANPGCEHWFALPELSATVEITYRRRNLDEWREIRRRVTALLQSWKPAD